MSRYKAYPEYKESGVQWLGTIPTGWNAISIKRKAVIFNGATPKSDVPSFWDGDIPWITPADLGKEKTPYIGNGARSISIDGYNSCGTSMVPKDSIVLASRAPIGTLGIATQALCTNQGCKSLVVSEGLISKFLFYVLLSSTAQLNLLGRGTTFLELPADELGAYKIPLPSAIEQSQVAAFLDHETAKIDALIEKQQRLIELLKEKRQAVISHAVTKGLNPGAPMKDSGVEWLGEVPAHWPIKSLRYLGNCQNGINIGAEYFGSGYPFVSYGDVYRNDTLPTQVEGLVQSTPIDRELYSVRTGDIFFTRTSETVDEIGFSAACLKTLENATFAGFLIRFRPNAAEVAVNFAKHYFRSSLMRAYFVHEMNLVTRASLSQDLLKRLPVPLPPENEQLEIAEYLDAKSQVFSKLTSDAETAIQLLKERRNALISAAVTGKIDVREWQAPA